jgi:hypothetical protein
MFTLILVVAMVVLPFLLGLTASGIQTYRNRDKK